ncbi:uncharacterized protein PV07_06211 [Cladophialophora immunda]|uniref:Uncharacterized protein n=1 Tax=Cladophialophora immunda TaxID=569365 RepID=A0A0D2D462_9EURO|nr:uncharacterized protein PV07_06211 [Cladophialophora immunda]KIW30469.1 hypothetical protein PV07_06211 [Cladophialophora immunda]
MAAITESELGTWAFQICETPKTGNPGAKLWGPSQTQDSAYATQYAPQGSLGRAPSCTTTAQNSLVITQAKWRNAQVRKRKWTLERSRLAAEYGDMQKPQRTFPSRSL